MLDIVNVISHRKFQRMSRAGCLITNLSSVEYFAIRISYSLLSSI